MKNLIIISLFLPMLTFGQEIKNNNTNNAFVVTILPEQDTIPYDTEISFIIKNNKGEIISLDNLSYYWGYVCYDDDSGLTTIARSSSPTITADKSRFYSLNVYVGDDMYNYGKSKYYHIIEKNNNK